MSTTIDNDFDQLVLWAKGKTKPKNLGSTYAYVGISAWIALVLMVTFIYIYQTKKYNGKKRILDAIQDQENIIEAEDA